MRMWSTMQTKAYWQRQEINWRDREIIWRISRANPTIQKNRRNFTRTRNNKKRVRWDISLQNNKAPGPDEIHGNVLQLNQGHPYWYSKPCFFMKFITVYYTYQRHGHLRMTQVNGHKLSQCGVIVVCSEFLGWILQRLQQESLGKLTSITGNKLAYCVYFF